MFTNTQIEAGILEAEKKFTECWSSLLILRRNGVDANELRRVVLSFQPTLGRALYKLETLYQKVCQEGRHLVARRENLSRKGFRKRLHTLNGFKHLLKESSDVGKALGDAYAWCFYEKERELLRKHFEPEPNPHPPTGIGGLGEIEFVTRLPLFRNCLVIAHSTTTFLRLGDISLIDLATRRVAAVGELKTCQAADSAVTIKTFLVGPEWSKKKMREARSIEISRSHPEPEPLPAQLQERLDRQLLRMKESFKPKTSAGTVGSFNTAGSFHHGKLRELYDQCSKVGSACLKADRGLLLFGLTLKGETLYGRLTATFPVTSTLRRLRMEQAAKSIIDKSIPDNSLRIDWVHCRAHQRYALERDMMPLFWWPLPAQLIEALLFKRFAVMTLYNPAFLFADLRRAGLQVNTTKDGVIRIWKQTGEKRFEVHGIPYFLRLLQCELLSEPPICTVIQHMVNSAEAAGFQQPATVNLDLNFEY